MTGMYLLGLPDKHHSNSTVVNVNIEGSSSAGFIWGYLSTRPSNIRIFKGPQDTYELHPWDAMILRDCTPNTGSLYALDSISSHKWDILVMKMCEDYNRKCFLRYSLPIRLPMFRY